MGSGKQIRIENAPNRWGRVTFDLVAKPETHSVVGRVQLTGPRVPDEVHFKLRLPLEMTLRSVAVNGEGASLAGIHNDTVVIKPGGKREFEIVGHI